MLVPSIFANSVFDDFFDFPYVNDKKQREKAVWSQRSKPDED